LNEKDGSVNWYHIFPPETNFDAASMFQVKEDIYLSLNPRSSSKKFLYTIDPQAQQVTLRCTLPKLNLSFQPDQTYFLSSDNEHTVGCIDIETCDILWSMGLLPKESNSQSFSGMFFWEDWLLLLNDYVLCGIDTKKQDVQFVYEFEFDGLIENQESYMMHSFVQSESILYIGIGPQDYDHGDSYLLAFDMATSQFLWKWQIPKTPVTEPGHYEGSIYLTMAPNLVDGSIFFITNRGDMYEVPVEY
jgi:outer membrane protein assembly factor BamB